MSVFFRLQQAVPMFGDNYFFRLDIVGELADVFDYFAKMVFVVANKLDVFLLLFEEDSDFVLLVGKLAFKLSYTCS